MRCAVPDSAAATIDWPRQIFEVLKAYEVRQVAHVPDAGHAALIRMCEADPAIQ